MVKNIWTNGCFDILHVGHIRMFKYAASLGDRLYVGIDSDEKVKQNSQIYGVGFITLIGAVILGVIMVLIMAFGDGEFTFNNVGLIIALVLALIGLGMMLYFQNYNSKCSQEGEESKPYLNFC